MQNENTFTDLEFSNFTKFNQKLPLKVFEKILVKIRDSYTSLTDSQCNL